MRSLILSLCLLAVCGIAYASSVKTVTATGYVTTGSTILVDASIYFRGVTVGDIAELRAGSSTGNIIWTAIADTANSNKRFAPTEPIQIDGGLYFRQSGSGLAGANVIYREF